MLSDLALLLFAILVAAGLISLVRSQMRHQFPRRRRAGRGSAFARSVTKPRRRHATKQSAILPGRHHHA